MIKKIIQFTFMVFIILIIVIGLSSYFTWQSLDFIRKSLPITTLEQHNSLRNLIDGLSRLSNSLIILKEMPRNYDIKDEAAIDLDICYSLFVTFESKIPELNSKKYKIALQELKGVLDSIDVFINSNEETEGVEIKALWTKLDQVVVLFNTTYLDTNAKVTLRLISEGKSIDKIKNMMVISFIIMVAAILFIWKLFKYQEETQLELENSKNELIEKNIELEKLSMEAHKSNNAKSEFLANMSHEIRTPMNAIIGLNHLIEKTELNKRQKDYVIKMKKAAIHLLNLLNDILDLSKIESGKLELEEMVFSMDSLLEDIGNVMSIKASEKGLELIIDKDITIPDYLVGDLLRIEQVFINLLNNAIKFTEKGEVILKVELIEKNDSKVKLLFSVIDDGIGIREEDQNRLFKEFSQIDASTSRKYGGTGLGLSISSKIVKMMGGEIAVESKVGEGSRFYFELEFIEEKEKNIAENRYPIPEKIREMKVMLIEKNDVVRKIMKNYLNDIGIKYYILQSSENALKMLRNEYFDLVFIDYKIGNNDGINIWREIKEDSLIEKRPEVILTTMDTAEEIIIKAEKEDISNILIKPVSESMVYNSIIEILYKRGQKKYAVDSYETEYTKEFDLIRGAKILVVEDNDINQQIIKEILTEENFEVIVASSGKDCIEILSIEQDIDLILMDIQMPGMDGIETTEYIRNEMNNTEIPIVALSANVTKYTRDKTVIAGINDYLFKPIDIKKLFKVMEKLIKPQSKNLPEKKSIKKYDENIMFDKNEYIIYDEGLKRVTGNKKLYIELLKTFILNNESIIENIKNNILNNEIKKAERLVHTLRGNSGNLGIRLVYEKSEKLEDQLEKNNISEEVESMIEDLEQELNESIKEINKLLKKNKIEIKIETEYEFFEKLKTLITEDIFEAKNYYEMKTEKNSKYQTEEWEELNDSIAIYDFDKAILLIEEKLKAMGKGDSDEEK